MKECSECGQWSAGSAKKCKHCGVSFNKYPPKEMVVFTPEERRKNREQREQSRVYRVFIAGGLLIGGICGGLWGDAIGGIFAIRWGVSRHREGWSLGGFIGIVVGMIAALFLYKMFFERGSEE
jgi:MFS family permease